MTAPRMVGEWRGPVAVGPLSRFDRGGLCPMWVRVCAGVTGGFRILGAASSRPVREVRK